MGTQEVFYTATEIAKKHKIPRQRIEYIIRFRKIAHAKKVGATRCYSQEQYERIVAEYKARRIRSSTKSK